MILEHAVLNIKSGQAKAFEAAMVEARPLIEATPGFLKMELRPCAETKDRYLLLVWWRSIEAHTHEFRGSARYAEWCGLTHKFYAPFPVVQHYLTPV